MSDYRIVTIGAENTAMDGPTNYSDIDLPTGYSDCTDRFMEYVKLADIIDEIYYEILNDPGLMYKGWITQKQWIRELYIASIYRKLKAYAGYHHTVFRLRTVKATSPIRRNKPYGRK